MSGEMGIRDGGRPPADIIINEVFFDKKCGLEKSHDRFYKWCSVASVGKKVKTQCEGISGSSGYCDFEAAFVKDLNSPLDNLTDYEFIANDTSIPEYPDKYPEYIYTSHSCNMGGQKATVWTNVTKISPDLSERIVRACHQEMYGVSGLPLWLILLVIFLVLLAISIAGSLFWTYWVKKKLDKKPGGSSRMSSRLTSAPFSSSSAKAGFTSAASRKKVSSFLSKNNANISKRGILNKNSKLPNSRSDEPSLRSAFTARQ